MNGKNNTLLSAFCHAKRWDINLQLFGEEGDGPDAAENAAAEQLPAEPAQTAQTGETLTRAQQRQAAAAGTWHKADPLAAVRYGRQEGTGRDADAPEKGAGGRLAQSAAEKEHTAGPDKEAAFEKLIRGEYKEQCAARTQRIIDQRFKKEKQAEQAAAGEKGAAGGAGRQAADAAPQTPDEPRAEPTETAGGKPGAESTEMRPDERREAGAEEAETEHILHNWIREGRELAKVYPDFSLEKAVDDPDFTRLLKGGVSVRRAYEACNLDTILGGAMQYTADRVAEGMAARAAARAARPAENGTTPLAGAILKTDVNSLTRADRDEIERRVAHGERIRF